MSIVLAIMAAKLQTWQTNGSGVYAYARRWKWFFPALLFEMARLLKFVRRPLVAGWRIQRSSAAPISRHPNQRERGEREREREEGKSRRERHAPRTKRETFPLCFVFFASFLYFFLTSTLSLSLSRSLSLFALSSRLFDFERKHFRDFGCTPELQSLFDC